MGLQDELEKGPSGDDSSSESSSSRSMSLGDALDARPKSFQVYGDYGSGKTTFALSVFDWFEENDISPEEAQVCVIDNDNGVLPIVKKRVTQGDLDREWLDEAAEFTLCNSWEDVKEATEDYLAQLRDHQQEYGLETAWLIEDNRQATWEWARDKFAKDVYGMREHELAKKKRKKARQEGKRTLPTYDQQVDYGAINGMYNALANQVKNSGVNFIWLAPEKKDYDQQGEVVGLKAGGQKHDPGRVDNIVHLREEEGDHEADLIKSRSADKRFENMSEPSLSKVLEFVEEH